MSSPLSPVMAQVHNPQGSPSLSLQRRMTNASARERIRRINSKEAKIHVMQLAAQDDAANDLAKSPYESPLLSNRFLDPKPAHGNAFEREAARRAEKPVQAPGAGDACALM